MKSCDNCCHSNATPVEPPCIDWQYCMNNNFCYFKPNLLYEIKTKKCLEGKYKMKRRIKVKKKENPYPKYSYNTSILKNNEPVWGVDNKWLIWEIKHGYGLKRI